MKDAQNFILAFIDPVYKPLRETIVSFSNIVLAVK